MLSDPIAAQEKIELVLETRKQADFLLRKLQLDRKRSEKRCEEFGFDDPVRDITGLSAMERAIVETKQAVSRMDDLISELRSATGALGGSSTVNGNGFHAVAVEEETEPLVPVGYK